MSERVEFSLATRAAPAAIATANDDECSMDAVMASELPARMRGDDWEPIDEVLSMKGAQFPSQVPLLNAHNRQGCESVIGHVKNIRAEGDELIGRVYFAKDTVSRNAYEKFRDGHMTDFSVGYSVDSVAKIAPGCEDTVHEKAYKAGEIGMHIVTKWTLKELSAVPIGADPTAKAREENDLSGHGGATHIRKGEQMASNTETTVPPVKLDEASKITVADLDAAKAGARAEAIKTERQRSADIERAMEGIEIPAEKMVAIRGCETADQARAMVLDEIRSHPKGGNAPAVHAPVAEVGDKMRAIEAAGVLAGGASEEFVAKHYGERSVDSARKLGRDLGPLGVCRHLLRLSGANVPDSATDVVHAAFGVRADGVSTNQLSVLLGNIANKSLLRGYSEQMDTWSRWCSVREVSDYKLNTAGRFDLIDGFQQVGAGGEVKSTYASEESETFQVGLYAEGFNISEVQLVNDDQGAFGAVPQKLGAAAKRYISQKVYEALLANGTNADGNAFVGTAHANYISGTDSAMSATYAVAALDLAVTKFLAQTGLAGQPLDIQPAMIIVPPEVSSVALSVFQSSNIVSGITNRVVSSNPYAGRFEVVTESRLSNANYTGYSATGFYLAAAASAIETFLVAFLRGSREPRIESSTADFNSFGLKYKASLRFGVKALDWRGIVGSKGAS